MKNNYMEHNEKGTYEACSPCIFYHLIVYSVSEKYLLIMMKLRKKENAQVTPERNCFVRRGPHCFD